jgi:hypothetical protein
VAPEKGNFSKAAEHTRNPVEFLRDCLRRTAYLPLHHTQPDLPWGTCSRHDALFGAHPAASAAKENRSMRSFWASFAGLATVFMACEAPPAPPDPTQQAIVGGAVSAGDPAIVEVLSFRGNLGARCTATLVTPRVLLLAAHCFVETPGFQRFVFTGNDDRNGGSSGMLPVKTFAYDPQYTTPRQGHDFGIVVMDAPLPAQPLRMNRASLDQAQGKTVRYVGYGLNTVGDRSSGGIKRENRAPLAQVSRLLLSIAPNEHGACEGDSGGPLLLDDGRGESIVGVGSFVVNPACRRDSFYQRLDTQLAWVDEQIRKYDPDASAPPSDGSAGDAGPGGPPDAGAPDPMPAPTTPPAPATAPDAHLADPPPPLPSPAPDARSPDPTPPPVNPPLPAGSSEGGCSYAPGGDAGLGALLLLTLACVRRRRRGRPADRQR